MSISPVEFPAFPAAPLGNVGGVNSVATPSLAPVAAPESADTEFGSLLIDGLDRLEGLTDRADTLAVEAATGRLENIHDYTIAASEAQVATQLTVALRNKAVEAFNEIMRMQV